MNGRIHSGFFIFIKPTRPLSDKAVLEHLGLGHFAPILQFRDTRMPFQVEDYLFITECSGWLHVADGLRYSLWNRSDRLPFLMRASQLGEVCAVMLGDVDESYEFVLIRDQERVRHRLVDSPHFRDRVVTIDAGTPLPAEDEALWSQDCDTIIFTLAESLGINTDHRESVIRCYGITEPA